MHFKCFLAVFFVSATFAPIAKSQMIIAHRGASHDAPENTLAAFELAWKLGADGIEADFHLTSDQKIVCIHDEDTSRVSPKTPVLKIAETDLETLQQLDVGTWVDPKFSKEKMPTLTQVLATVPPGKQIFIELKTGTEILPILKHELAQTHLSSDQIHIISFKSNVVRQVRRTMPEYATSWLVDYFKHRGDSDITDQWRPKVDRVINRLEEIGATGLDSRNVPALVDQEFVDSVKSRGIEFHVWNVDDPHQAIRLRFLGVKTITTNRPALLKCVLNSTYEK